MGLLRRSLKGLLRIQIDRAELDRLPWRDFGNGVAMARLARAGARELVLYRIRAGADPNEAGAYSEGELVYLDPKSVHTPRAEGETVVLVLWPQGVRILE